MVFEAISHLEYALEYMPDERFDPDIHMLIGNAHAIVYSRGDDNKEIKGNAL